MGKKQTILIFIALILVVVLFLTVYQHQKQYVHGEKTNYQEQINMISEVFPPPPPLKLCNFPFHYEIVENSSTTLKTIPWLTFENKEYHYHFDYPYILILNTDSQFPNVQFFTSFK